MPVSDHNNISAIMREVAKLQPRNVLDLGCGFGKYGLLCRELLDIQPGRLTRDQWVTNILGVEGFEQYRNPIHDWIYNDVKYENFTKQVYKGFDLVMMIDSLEHIDKPEGHRVLDQLINNNAQVIVSCPTGANYLEQGAVYGNEFERHRAHWTPDDLIVRGGRILYSGVCVVASIKGQRTGNLWIR